MGDFDPSAARRTSAFRRLASKKAGESGADPPKKWTSGNPCRFGIFNQVQVSSGSSWGKGSSDPRLAGLNRAVDDLKASTHTLFNLSEASREVREANFGASAASVKEVEAAARLAEDLGRRIVDNDEAATEAQADNLSRATVERLLRS